MPVIQAVRWSPDGSALRIIDQTRLPERFLEVDLRTVDEMADAICRLAVRGAPAIGVAAAIGLAVSLFPYAREPVPALRHRAIQHAHRLRETRPTAVNLAWALDRMLHCAALEAPDGSVRSAAMS